MPKSDKPAAEHASDFDAPLYNVWKQQKKTPGSQHFGNSEVRDWLSRIDKDAKEARDKRIFELWLACWTQEEIASECSCDEKTVTKVVSGISAELPKFQKSAAEHVSDFDAPIKMQICILIRTLPSRPRRGSSADCAAGELRSERSSFRTLPTNVSPTAACSAIFRSDHSTHSGSFSSASTDTRFVGGSGTGTGDGAKSSV